MSICWFCFEGQLTQLDLNCKTPFLVCSSDLSLFVTELLGFFSMYAWLGDQPELWEDRILGFHLWYSAFLSSNYSSPDSVVSLDRNVQFFHQYPTAPCTIPIMFDLRLKVVKIANNSPQGIDSPIEQSASIPSLVPSGGYLFCMIFRVYSYYLQAGQLVWLDLTHPLLSMNIIFHIRFILDRAILKP